MLTLACVSRALLLPTSQNKIPTNISMAKRKRNSTEDTDSQDTEVGGTEVQDAEHG
jgi:hypothetical protein